MSMLASTLERFLTVHPLQELNASANTIATYRNTCVLLLGHMHDHTKTPMHQMDLAIFEDATVAGVLTYCRRGVGAPSVREMPCWPRFVHFRLSCSPSSRACESHQRGDAPSRETTRPRRPDLPDRIRIANDLKPDWPQGSGDAVRHDHDWASRLESDWTSVERLGVANFGTSLVRGQGRQNPGHRVEYRNTSGHRRVVQGVEI